MKLKGIFAVAAALVAGGVSAGYLRSTKPIEQADGAPEEVASAPLFRKTMVVIGDSYVANHRRPTEETWHYRLAEKYQMRYFNYGKNGNDVILPRKGWGATVLERFGEMEPDASLIVVIGGHNDAGVIDTSKALESGKADAQKCEKVKAERVKAFREGVAKLADGLKAKYPEGKIVFVSPWNVQRPGFEDVLTAYREILPEKGVFFYDAARLSGLDPHDKEGDKAKLWQGPTDTAHLSYAGHTIMLEKMEPFLLASISAESPAPPPSAGGGSTADDIARYESGGELEADPAEQAVDAPKDMKLILCIGQSNMAGRAKLEAADREGVPGAFKLNRDGKWVPAKSPYHFDRKYAAVGPVDDFVRLYLADHPGETVGVVPCAVGGSPAASWSPTGKGRNGANYRRALDRAKTAQANGKFIAILWHQGETDAAKYSAEDLAQSYPGKVKAIAEALRAELGDETIPFIVGEIGRWQRKDGDHAAKINPAIDSIPGILPHCAAVSSEGLTNQDQHHFDRASQRKLAERYYEAFKSLK